MAILDGLSDELFLACRATSLKQVCSEPVRQGNSHICSRIPAVTLESPVSLSVMLLFFNRPAKLLNAFAGCVFLTFKIMSNKPQNPAEEMSQEGKVDQYFYDLFFKDDDIPAKILERSLEAGLPTIHVTPHHGRLLNFLLTIQGAKRVLEIGTLGGYSTAWMALALPEEGRLISLESKPECAEFARKNMEDFGLADKVEILHSKAAEALEQMLEKGEAPFDFVFMDADKHNNPVYLDYVLKLSRPGTLIFADNMVRRGKILDANSTAGNIQGMRKYHEMLSEATELESTAIQTVGDKIWDGFILTRVK